MISGEASRRHILEALLVSSLTFLVFFLAVLTSGLFHQAFQSVDITVAGFFERISTPAVATVFLFITYLGNPEIIFSLTCAALLVLLAANRRRDMFVFLFAIAVGEGTAVFLKLVTARVRPASLYFQYAGADSFPSGHALVSMLFYGLLAYFLAEQAENPRSKRLIYAISGALVFLIGLSRLYLGVHWLSDVLAGWALGFVLLCLFISLFNRLKTLHDGTSVLQPARHFSLRLLHFIIAVLVIAQVFIIISFYQKNPLLMNGPSAHDILEPL